MVEEILVALNEAIRYDSNGQPQIGIFWFVDGRLYLSYLGALPTWSVEKGEKDSAGGLAHRLMGYAIKSSEERQAVQEASTLRDRTCGSDMTKGVKV